MLSVHFSLLLLAMCSAGCIAIQVHHRSSTAAGTGERDGGQQFASVLAMLFAGASSASSMRRDDIRRTSDSPLRRDDNAASSPKTKSTLGYRFSDYSCAPFVSGALAEERATDIRSLKVSDVRIVMAMGDSATAGFGATGGLVENRGASWAIGGDKHATTLANFFRHFNADVMGFSAGNHALELHGQPHHFEQDGLNAAQSGAVVQDMVSQVDYLEAAIRRMPRADIENDWKVLTLWVGGNNICSVCLGKPEDSPSAFEAALDRALQRLRQRIPRVFVNLIPYGPMSRLKQLGQQNPVCSLVHAFANECPCAFRARNRTDVKAMDDAVVAYNRVLHGLAKKYARLRDPQFAVVVQPFMQETHIQDATFLSSLDCFHPSLLAHETMAVHLWNSMLLPRAQKTRKLIPNWKPMCPSATTRLDVS
jgi:phospholipase B1